MKVLNYVSAKAIWLFDVADLNPKGKSLYPEFADWIKDFYRFKEFPTSSSSPDDEPKEKDGKEGKGLEFKKGEYQTEEEMFVVVDLTIWGDGLVANSSKTTNDTDRFLADVLKNASVEFSLSFDENMIRKKLYSSELNIRLDQAIGNLNPRLSAFADKLTALLPDVKPFSAGGISFWTDTTFSVTKTPPFSIERRLNAPFNENRFYAKAPLPTDQHIALLNELEDILATV